MKRRHVLALAVAVALMGTLTACGVKDDLEKPNAKPLKKGEQDPSKPPSSLGQ